MEYKLLAAATPDALSKAVTEALNEGWQLYEAPAIGQHGYEGSSTKTYIQAVTRNTLQTRA